MVLWDEPCDSAEKTPASTEDCELSMMLATATKRLVLSKKLVGVAHRGGVECDGRVEMRGVELEEKKQNGTKRWRKIGGKMGTIAR